MNDTLALTLWILSELLNEIFTSLWYVFPLVLVLLLLNIVFLWFFHLKVQGWHEFLVFMFINHKLVAHKDHYFRFRMWKFVHILARQYYWLKFKFAR